MVKPKEDKTLCCLLFAVSKETDMKQRKNMEGKLDILYTAQNSSGAAVHSLPLHSHM